MCVCAVAKGVVQIVRECFVFFFPLAELAERKNKTKEKNNTVT
jgi:hypothetical protein